jgi:hypothetical protein
MIFYDEEASSLQVNYHIPSLPGLLDFNAPEFNNTSYKN